MNKKRFLAAALLLCMPLLSGCSSMVSERAMEDISALTIEAGAEVPMEDEFADETRRVTLYTLSDKRKTLVPVVREITCVNEKSLAQAALDALIREHQPAVFFSKDLFARYFTYTKNGESHFILFDDADTLRQKLRLGRQLGVAAAFFQWPEVCDIADSLFRRK